MDAGEPYTVRFKVAPGKRVDINDIVRGPVGWDADATVGDFILLRSSGMPVYNFCVAGKSPSTYTKGWQPSLATKDPLSFFFSSFNTTVDDALMGITTVVRAEEHLTNTLRQCLILEALKYPQVRPIFFTHHLLLLLLLHLSYMYDHPPPTASICSLLSHFG